MPSCKPLIFQVKNPQGFIGPGLSLKEFGLPVSSGTLPV